MEVFMAQHPPGGSKGGGTVYKYTTAGAYSIVYPINDDTEGSVSTSALVKGNDGALYAMTNSGGTNNNGIIFKTTTSGAFTVLNNFNGSSVGNTLISSFIKGKDSAYYCTHISRRCLWLWKHCKKFVAAKPRCCFRFKIQPTVLIPWAISCWHQTVIFMA
jgi:uncharacterized repeat protein (TIGR03803 family)